MKAGGGKEITIGEMIKQFLTKLEWFDTRWPRIPVPVQKEIDDYMEQMKKYMIGFEETGEADDRSNKRLDDRYNRDGEASRGNFSFMIGRSKVFFFKKIKGSTRGFSFQTVEIGKEIVTEIEIDEIGVTGTTREVISFSTLTINISTNMLNVLLLQTIMTEKIATEIARGTETVGIEIETETETGVTEIEIINTNLRNIRQIARKIENIAGELQFAYFLTAALLDYIFVLLIEWQIVYI